MDRLIEIFMDKFFQVAEYLCDKFEPSVVKPVAPVAPKCQQQRDTHNTIYFSNADKMVEGELFAK